MGVTWVVCGGPVLTPFKRKEKRAKIERSEMYASDDRDEAQGSKGARGRA
jgi:hypothetical protein